MHITYSSGRPGRILVRPTILWRRIAFKIFFIFCLITIFYIVSLIILFNIYIPIQFLSWIQIEIIWAFIIISSILFCFRKRILIFMILLYQKYAPEHIRLRCNFEPSCSEYAILAINKYGVLKGSWKTWQRLKRCFPPGGIDYP